MGLITPAVNYNSIKINDKDITLSGSCRASFTAPYNKIDFVMTPTNCSLSYYEIRITQASADYDIGVGEKAYWDVNIAANAQKSFSIDINSKNFKYGDGVYRLSLYAKSSVDGSWDVTYLFFTVDNEQFVPVGADGMEVLTDRDAPEQK